MTFSWARQAGAALLTLFVSLGARSAEPVPITLNDLFADEDVRDAAISPSGRYLAVIVRQEPNDVVVVQDLESGERKIPISINRSGAGERFETRMSTVYWKTDDRILFRVKVRPKEGTKVENLTRGNFGKLGDRLFAVNRDGTKAVRLLGDSRSSVLTGALNLGAIGSMLRNDPDHVNMLVYGNSGLSIIRVNVTTGDGEVVEYPVENLVGWWLDVEGTPVVRVIRSLGTVRFQRKDAEGKWKEFHRIAVREMQERPDYVPVGASNQPGKYYVLARPPGRERAGVYLYDLTHESFGEPIAEHPVYDLDSAQVSPDGTRLLSHCYIADVRVCELTDAKTNAHMKGIRKYFQDSANVYVTDVAADNNTIVLFVEGTSLAPSYFYYRMPAKKIEFIGFERNSLFNKTLPTSTVVRWKGRDGRDLTGYLTRPPGAENAHALPLIVHPHGGPQLRDHREFARWVQFFTSRGYAVFQPNFRGSEGFGRTFAESGYGEWGRAMQNDITDGVAALAAQSAVDPARVCIVGASYGGYAALAGATLTPDLYKCAVSIAGVSDLPAFVKWFKFEHGPDSAGTAYWQRAIGDPEADLPRLRAVSPINLTDSIKADVLLIHGDQDDVVPISQSQAMKRALDKSRRKTTLIELEDEGHSYWSEDNERLALESIDAFLLKNLGPGFKAAQITEAKSNAQ